MIGNVALERLRLSTNCLVQRNPTVGQEDLLIAVARLRLTATLAVVERQVFSLLRFLLSTLPVPPQRHWLLEWGQLHPAASGGRAQHARENHVTLISGNTARGSPCVPVTSLTHPTHPPIALPASHHLHPSTP